MYFGAARARLLSTFFLLIVLIHEAGGAEPGHFWGIKTGLGPKYLERRQRWRQSGCADRYRDAGIAYRFFVGAPLQEGHSLHGHNQGGVATKAATQIAEALLAEAERHGDMVVLPLRDVYMDLSHKTLSIMRYGYRRTNASFIGTHDDEYCLKIPAVRAIEGAERQHGQLLYAGNYLWAGTEYKSMTGPSNWTAPYFSGHGYFLERRLVKLAVIRNWDEAVLHQRYGTTADDANMGKWVKLAIDKYDVRVKMAEKRILEEVAKMQV